MRVRILRKYDPAEWGGTESAIHLLASGLSRSGIASIVYAPRLAKGPGEADPFAGLGGALKRYRAVVPVWGISAERRRRMIALGGNVISLDLAASLWREPRLDVVHTHALGRLGAVAGAIARGRGKPFVVSVHGGAYDLPPTVRQTLQASGQGGLDWGRAVGFVFRSRDLFSVADAIITCNPSEAEKIRQRHPGRRVIVQPHGVRVADYSADRRAAARQAFPHIVGRKVLLMPGRIDPVKNQAWLIEHMAEVAHRHPHALLVLAGGAADPAYGSLVPRLIDERACGKVSLLVNRLARGSAGSWGLFQEAGRCSPALAHSSETFGPRRVRLGGPGRPAGR